MTIAEIEMLITTCYDTPHFEAFDFINNVTMRLDKHVMLSMVSIFAVLIVIVYDMVLL